MSFELVAIIDFCFSAANVAFALSACLALCRSGKVSSYPLLLLFFVSSSTFNTIFTSNMFLGFLDLGYYGRLYWANELVEQGFAMAMMVCVMRFALAGERSSAILSQGLASVAVVLVAALLTQGSPSFGSLWMTGFTRNLSFGIALMNFQVWGLLLGRRVKSREILLLASGLGLLTTGKSLGHTIRIVAERGGWAELFGNYLVVATSILASYVWWHAFRSASKKPLTLVKAA